MSPESLRLPLINETIREIPEIQEDSPSEVDILLDELISEYAYLESKVTPHPDIHEEADAIVVFSGPGAISKNVSPYTDKDDRYSQLPWSRKMDRARLKVAAFLMREITAKRLNREVSEITDEDVINNGPYLHYAGTPWENDHLKEAIKSGEIKIPLEKLYSYSEIEDPSGNKRTIGNTADQITGFKMPEKPRRIVIVDHPAHLVRVLHMFGMFPERIPEGAVLQPFPIPTPKDGEFDYAKMELKGTLAYIYKYNLAHKKAIPYEK